MVLPLKMQPDRVCRGKAERGHGCQVSSWEPDMTSACPGGGGPGSPTGQEPLSPPQSPGAYLCIAGLAEGQSGSRAGRGCARSPHSLGKWAERG